MSFMKRLRGFTLSELMIAITVLGILTATVLPALLKNNPNQNKMMMKKAYYTLSSVVSELINDTSIYPGENGVCPDDPDGGKYIGLECGGPSKFAYYFAKHVNVEPRVTETLEEFKTDTGYEINPCDHFTAGPCHILKTSDGMVWEFLKEAGFTSQNKGRIDVYSPVLIDINGDKGPNCYQSKPTNDCKDKTSSFDQFIVFVYTDGGLELPLNQVWAKEAISVTSDLTGK